MSAADIPSSFISSIAEIYKLMPDSILFGSIILYFLTQNVSFGVFAIFIIEVIVLHRGISWFFSQTNGSVSGSHNEVKCRAGFKTVQINAGRMFMHDPYPSYSIFSLTAIATYIGMSVSEFSDILQKMGDQWVLHSQLSKYFIMFVIFAFVITRYVTGCDSNVNEIVIAGILAVITGVIFFYINKKLFGMEGINFLGLPMYEMASEDGSPIYICGNVKQ
jgi:hypothetical protein